ncbi:MAG: hypothetical protein ACF8K1_12795 [Phycisphaerales bacterium JB047]
MNRASLRSIGVVSASRPRIACLLACHVAIAFGLVGCDDASVQEEQVAKGIEDIPAPEQTDEPSGGQPADTGTPEQHDSGFPWAVPEGWVLDETPRQMRIATYMAPTESGEQEVAVTRFPGRVGGELANINRWRGQMGLAPIEQVELENQIERFSAEGYDGYQVRIDSDRGTMLAAGVFDESINQTWFVRATLSEASLADQLEEDVFAMARSIAR